MKKLILLLSLFSLPTTWAMNLDERKDDGLDFPELAELPMEHDGQSAVQIYEPDYSQDPEVGEVYVSAKEAITMFSENLLEKALLSHKILPEIVKVIHGYADEKYDYNSYDSFINDTPLYNDLPLKVQQDIKKYCKKKLENALLKRSKLLNGAEIEIPLTGVLETADKVWQELLKNNPFPTNELRHTLLWRVSPDQKKILRLYTKDKCHRFWHVMLYDLENNQVIQSFDSMNIEKATLLRDGILITHRTSDYGSRPDLFTLCDHDNNKFRAIRKSDGKLYYYAHSEDSDTLVELDSDTY